MPPIRLLHRGIKRGKGHHLKYVAGTRNERTQNMFCRFVVFCSVSVLFYFTEQNTKKNFRTELEDCSFIPGQNYSLVENKLSAI